MTNKEKAQEIGEKCATIVMEKCSCEYECTQSALLMAHWKDEQFAKEKQALIDKACEWWESELIYPTMTRTEIDLILGRIKDFKQAMKGGNYES